MLHFGSSLNVCIDCMVLYSCQNSTISMIFHFGVEIFQEGYKFWGTNFSCWCTNSREGLLIQSGGHKFPKGIQIFQRGMYLFVSKFISCWCTNFPGGVLIWGV